MLKSFGVFRMVVPRAGTVCGRGASVSCRETPTGLLSEVGGEFYSASHMLLTQPRVDSLASPHAQHSRSAQGVAAYGSLAYPLGVRRVRVSSAGELLVRRESRGRQFRRRPSEPLSMAPTPRVS